MYFSSLFVALLCFVSCFLFICLVNIVFHLCSSYKSLPHLLTNVPTRTPHLSQEVYSHLFHNSLALCCCIRSVYYLYKHIHTSSSSLFYVSCRPTPKSASHYTTLTLTVAPVPILIYKPNVISINSTLLVASLFVCIPFTWPLIEPSLYFSSTINPHSALHMPPSCVLRVLVYLLCCVIRVYAIGFSCIVKFDFFLFFFFFFLVFLVRV